MDRMWAIHGCRGAARVSIERMSARQTADRRSHWEAVYRRKDEDALSWHQDDPALSQALVQALCPPGGRVLDVGGGTSLLAARLSATGRRVTVLELSAAAVQRALERCGRAADGVAWVVGDVVGPDWPIFGAFDVWHDRAVLHFLSDPAERRLYAQRARDALRPGGHAVVSTFAPDGPERCSDLPVQRYDAEGLSALFAPELTLVETRRDVHRTPWGSEQAFTCAVLRRSA